MRAIRIQAYGGPDVMQLEELPTPVPGSGEALVRIQAAGVNFLDVQKRRGELVGQAFYHRVGGNEPDLPATMGSQGVGVVEALGPEVTNSKVGARVAFWGSSYATHALVPAQRLVAIPEEVTFEQVAAGMNQGFLAYVYTHFVYPVKPGAGAWCKPPPEASDCCCAKWPSFVKAESLALPRQVTKQPSSDKPAPTKSSFLDSPMAPHHPTSPKKFAASPTAVA
jgi:hypothetical protein